MVALTPLMTNKPVLKNPVDKNRSPPDRLINQTCLIVILLACWFISCSFYLMKASLLLIQFQTLPSGINLTLNGEMTMPLSSINFHENATGFSTWIVLSVPIIFFILLKTLNILSRLWTAIGLFLLAPFFIVLPLYNIAKIIYEVHYSTQVEFKPWMNLVLIETYQIALYMLVFHGTATNFCRVANIIKKTSRVISFFPALFLFGFITLILSTTVIVSAAVGFKYFGDTVYGYSSIFGGIYVFLLIFHFVIALISHCAFTWCCAENKKELTGFIILKSICRTFRNHGGLILFNCTVILPAIRWLFSLRIRKFNPDFPYAGLKAYIVREWLISNGLEYAFPLVASHKALKDKIYSIFTRSLFVCFSFSAVFGNLLAFFSVIAKIIVFCGTSIILAWNNTYHLDLANQTALYLALIIYSFGFMFVSLVIGASVFVFSITEDIKESVEQEVIAVKQGEGIELCIINQIPETDETLIM